MLAALVVPPAHGQMDYGFDFSKVGSAGFQFLKIGMGAREAALGEAASGLTRDANAVYWNPGALPLMEGTQARFTHARWIANSRAGAAVVAVPLGAYVVAFNVWSMGIESFEETTVEQPDGTGNMVGAGDLLVGVAAARRFTDRLTIGLQAKYVREHLDETRFQNVLFDVGTVYYTGLHNLRLAITLQHFGADVRARRQRFRMPLLFRVSAAEDVVNTPSMRLSTAIELVHPTDNTEWVNVGLETVLLDAVALRGGYRFNVDEGRLSLGAGVQTPAVTGIRLGFDYAYVPFGDVFGATHRITVGLGLK